MAEIEASQTANEESRKTNEDLRKSLQQCERQGLSVPEHYITPKIVFTGVEDVENHTPR